MEKRENELLEFKKTLSELKEGIISLASMLNKNHSGVLYFGVKNDGEIFGQQIGINTTNDISNAIKNYIKPRITPKIEILEAENKNIIKVSVVGENTPYSAYGRYYIRSDDEDNEMTNEQLESFFLNKTFDYSAWENQLTPYTINDVDEELVISYLNKANECGRINYLFKDTETTLLKLGLLKDGHLNNAGLYLFSTIKPITLKLACFNTDERISFSDLKQFRGNIFECINEAVKYISNNIKWKANIVGIERIEVPEIPIEAIREIVVNSFVHMKVNNSSYNEIYITPTRIHIYNPGSLVQGTDPRMFAEGIQGSMIRNPLIASVLYYNKSIDAFGTGFERVFRLLNNKNYHYANNDFGFTFEFLRNQNDLINDTINDTINYLSIDEKKVFEIISKNEKQNKEQISHIIGKSIPTVQRIISKLIKKNLIERVGSNKNGFWVIKHK